MSNSVIQDAFLNFGYTPSKEELASLSPTYAGEGGGTRGNASVAAYVNTVRLLQEQKQNDPLNQVIADERGFFSDTARKAAEDEANLKGPVKLFGGLSEDQINQYLSPLNQSTMESGARLEGDAARRGIAGSSTEMNALAENERLFRQNVLSTGLNIGLSERDRTAQLLGTRYNLLAGSLGRQGQVAGQLSAQDFEGTQLRAQLPIYLRGVSSQELATQNAIQARKDAEKRARKGGNGSVGGTIGGGAIGFFASGGNPMGAAIGAGVGGQLGGSIGQGM